MSVRIFLPEYINSIPESENERKIEWRARAQGLEKIERERERCQNF